MGKLKPLAQLDSRDAGRRLQRFLHTGRFEQAGALIDECGSLPAHQRDRTARVLADYMAITEIDPAHKAGMEQHAPELMDKLHGLGVDPNQMTFAGATPLLMHAVATGHLSLARKLLELGADPNQPSTQDKITTLMQVPGGNVDMVHALMEYGANIDACDQWEKPALWYLAATGGVEAMQLLVKWGADIGARDAFHATLLHHLAEALSHPDRDPDLDLRGAIRQAVLLGVDPEATDGDGHTALETVRGSENEDLMRSAINEAQAMVQAGHLHETTQATLPRKQRTRL